MAKSNAQKKEEARARDAQAGIVKKEWPVTEETWRQVEALCEREGIEDWRELLTLMVFNVESKAFEIPRVKLTDEFIRKYMP